MNTPLVIFLSLWISASSFPPQTTDTDSNMVESDARDDLSRMLQRLLSNPEKRNLYSNQEEISNELVPPKTEIMSNIKKFDLSSSNAKTAAAKEAEFTTATDSTDGPADPGTSPTTTKAPESTKATESTVSPTDPGTSPTTTDDPESTKATESTVSPTDPGTSPTTTKAPESTKATESTVSPTTTNKPETTTPPKPSSSSKTEYSLLLLFPFLYSIFRQ